MPRGAASEADRELTRHLAQQGLNGSPERYERWRRAGLLPPHQRRGLGRGRGSISVPAPGAVEIAAVLARHSGQGRDLREAVIAWFFDAATPDTPGADPVPEPPHAQVIAALEWAIRREPAYRMVQRARAAVTEQQKNALYKALDASRRTPTAAGFDANAVRTALQQGDELPDTAFGTRPGAAVVHLATVLGMGYDEVGGQALADAYAASGLLPHVTQEEWREALLDAELSGQFDAFFARLGRFDPVAAVQSASVEQLRRAREVTLGLAGFGSFYLMHALLMPDTPGLARLRALLDATGMAPLVVDLARMMMRPHRAAMSLGTFIDPWYQSMYDSLSAAVAAGPPLLHQSGQQAHDPDRYMTEWLAAIRSLSDRAEPEG